MTHPPSPPNSRRRWIIALVAILAVGWWFRPRVDQRFVGKWQMTRAPDVYLLELKVDGTGREYVNGLPANVPFRWSVYNDTLFFSVYPPDRPILFSRVEDIAAGLQGIPMPWSTFQKVDELTANRLSLLRSPSHYQPSFQRMTQSRLERGD